MYTEDATAVAMVRLGYACDDPTDQRRVLDFRAVCSLEGACAAVDAIDRYNEFDARRVVPALRQIAKLDDYVRFLVGREGSPVIYVRGLFLDEKIQRAKAILVEAGADECDAEGYRGVRAWWD